MKRAALILVALTLAGAARYETQAPETEAFSQPFAGLEAPQSVRFRRGSGLFRQAWLIGPSEDHPDLVGLGPLYNRLSCIACHVKNGRGAAPDAENGLARHMAARLSVEGSDAHGGPRAHPAYGAQLNPEGVPGVAGEGQAVIAYDEEAVTLEDGERVTLRRPKLAFRNLAYGEIGADSRISVRNAPPVFGLGLLEAVPEAEILAGKGKPNYVWDIEAKAHRLGRFGLKANQPGLKQQIANAFAEDIGVTSSLFPQESCAVGQSACVAAGSKKPDLSDAQLDATTAYIRLLAVPARRGADAPNAVAGEAQFRALGCAACHRETLRVGDFADAPSLSGSEIHPYTDLLLHDMGDGLADGRADYEAGPRDWRTPPLWGLGLAGKGGDGANYLHDARARTLAEAILWHRGEAQDAADGFRRLPKSERDALLAFLNSL
ncbi:di-heme oxidoredictase family protein [Methylocystis parvus]|uniref:Thiol oxidoreductase n=1 Tax=Methylocystis parvus TaxID=134 RepID=A0A6B8M6E4_9HYPH|nr:di-heme oxidoredictase family protein [Methylocystis parvus]QGM98471.1 thiol oxidoreductase [Methylocystis parvus]WBK01191.1 thiol oxidoreductase [Methylocystis parvus OBBP]